MVVFHAVLQLLLLEDIRNIQHLLVRRLGEISPVCLLHRDNHASAVQSRIVREFRAANYLWTESLKRAAFAETH